MKRFGIFLVLLCLLLNSCSSQAEDVGELTVVFLEVGKADAILLQTDSSAVLIDAGTNKMGEEIVKQLQARGVETLDLLIITHFDKDHVGGADKVLEAFPVSRALEPAYEKDGKQFQQYRDALDLAGLRAEALVQNLEFTLDHVKYSIDVANQRFYGEDEENDFSLVVRATHGQVRFLFAGDAENARLGELLAEGDLRSDVLKVPHHGVYENLSAAFFEAVNAKYAVITADEENPEDSDTLYALEFVGSQVLNTREGAVAFLSDGQEVLVQPRN